MQCFLYRFYPFDERAFACGGCCLFFGGVGRHNDVFFNRQYFLLKPKRLKGTQLPLLQRKKKKGRPQSFFLLYDTKMLNDATLAKDVIFVIVCFLIYRFIPKKTISIPLIFIVIMSSVLPLFEGCSDQEYLCCDDAFPLTYSCEPCEDCCKRIQWNGMGDAAASEDNTLNCPEHCNCSANIGERCQEVFKVYNQNKCYDDYYICDYEGKPRNENNNSSTLQWCRKCKDMEKDFDKCKAKIQVKSPTWKA